MFSKVLSLKTFNIILFFFALIYNFELSVNAREAERDKCIVEEIEKIVKNLNNDQSRKRDPAYWNFLGDLYRSGTLRLDDRSEFYDNKSLQKKCMKKDTDFMTVVIYPSGDLMSSKFLKPDIAYQMYLKGYALGSTESAAKIAEMNMIGNGTPRNLELALKYSLEAAKGGSLLGQEIAGYLYTGYDGIGSRSILEAKNGLKPNLILAYMWFNVMSARGDKGADQIRDQIQKKLNPDDLVLAQKISTVCFFSNYKNCPTEISH
jgi:hypothetical protein